MEIMEHVDAAEQASPQKSEPEMLTVRQAAARGVLPERTLRGLIAKKKIPVIQSGKIQYLNFTLLVEMLQDPEAAIWK